MRCCLRSCWSKSPQHAIPGSIRIWQQKRRQCASRPDGANSNCTVAENLKEDYGIAAFSGNGVAVLSRDLIYQIAFLESLQGSERRICGPARLDTFTYGTAAASSSKRSVQQQRI